MVFWVAIGRCFLQCYASWKLRRARKKLDRIKLINYRKSVGLNPRYTIREKISNWFSRLFKPGTRRLKALLCPCCLPEDDPLRKKTFGGRIWVNGTKENHFAKCTAGFVAGVLLSLFVWASAHGDPITLSEDSKIRMFMGNRDPSPLAEVLMIIGGICITICLTFSEACRCILILAIAQLFTNKGRIAILAYISILALSGPAQNSTVNMEILAESLACGQELVKKTIMELYDFAKTPFASFQKAISTIIESIQGVFGRMKHELQTIIETVGDIVELIKKAYNMLADIVNVCNSKFGTPYDRCVDAFATSAKDCVDVVGDTFDWVCTAYSKFDFFCYFAKAVDLVCWLPSAIKEATIVPVKGFLKDFKSRFVDFTDARFNNTRAFKHKLEQDKSLQQVFSGMKDEILEKSQWIFDFIKWVDWALVLPTMIILYKALHYRWKYLASDRFDNYYLSDSLIRMDIRRHAAGGRSIFPLRNREKNLYVETLSWRLIKQERKKRMVSITLVFISSIQILQYLLIDFLLYKFMEFIRLNAAVEYKSLDDPVLGLTATVEGDGFMAAMYRTILEGLNPVNFVLPSLDTTQCMPIANKPNYRTYFWIIFLLLVCLALAIFEPYGLRLRHLICGWIYPVRHRERERWLYVHIMTTRDSFMSFAAKAIRDKIGFKRKKGKQAGGKTFSVSITERLVHMFPILKKFVDPTSIKCFVCGTTGNHDDRENFIDCMECHTIYCMECMQDMHDKCAVCNNKMDSDASATGGSEDDLELEDVRDHVVEKKPLLKKKSKRSKKRKRRF